MIKNLTGLIRHLSRIRQHSQRFFFQAPKLFSHQYFLFNSGAFPCGPSSSMPPPPLPVFNSPCIIKELRDAAHSQDTQTHPSAPSSILGAVYSSLVYVGLLMASSGSWALTARRAPRGDVSARKGRRGKWPVSYFVDAKPTVPRRDEVSGMCVTADCLTPEQLGICSGALVSFTHIPCCQRGRSLVPVHKHSVRHCARCRTLCVCVCVFRFHVSSDDQAQQAGRQQQFDRWELSPLCWLCLRRLFASLSLLHLFPTDSAWQHGSPGFQELKAEVTEVPAPDSSPDATGGTVIPSYKPPCFRTIPMNPSIEVMTS